MYKRRAASRRVRQRSKWPNGRDQGKSKSSNVFFLRSVIGRELFCDDNELRASKQRSVIWIFNFVFEKKKVRQGTSKGRKGSKKEKGIGRKVNHKYFLINLLSWLILVEMEKEIDDVLGIDQARGGVRLQFWISIRVAKGISLLLFCL